MFLLWPRQLPQCGDWTPASVPPPSEGRSSPDNTPVSPPSSFILWSFAWFSIFFSSGQVLLSALRWCSASTSVSEGVFLMYPWKEMYSTSTYSSTILYPIVFSFSLYLCILSHIFLVMFFSIFKFYSWILYVNLCCCFSYYLFKLVTVDVSNSYYMLILLKICCPLDVSYWFSRYASCFS